MQLPLLTRSPVAAGSPSPRGLGPPLPSPPGGEGLLPETRPPLPTAPTFRTGRVALADGLHQPQVTAGGLGGLRQGLHQGLRGPGWLGARLPLAVVAQDAVGRLHDDRGVEALGRHGQELVIVFAGVPGVAGVALKLLEGADSLGLDRRGGRLGRGLEQAAKQKRSILAPWGLSVVTLGRVRPAPGGTGSRES